MQDRHVKVSLFLQNELQNHQGVMIIPREGPLPPGVEFPGKIRLFDSIGNQLTEKTFSYPLILELRTPETPKTKLGQNL